MFLNSLFKHPEHLPVHLFLPSCSAPQHQSQNSPSPLQAQGSMALLKAACSCLTPEGLIHCFQVIRKVPSNNPELRPSRFQLSPKTSGGSWHFPISCLVFPSHALAYLQAFKFLKGRAVLYYTSGQCLTQEGPSLIRVSCDYRSTNTAKKMHLKWKKAVMLLFQLALTLEKSEEVGLSAKGKVAQQEPSGHGQPFELSSKCCKPN